MVLLLVGLVFISLGANTGTIYFCNAIKPFAISVEIDGVQTEIHEVQLYTCALKRGETGFELVNINPFTGPSVYHAWQSCEVNNLALRVQYSAKASRKIPIPGELLDLWQTTVTHIDIPIEFLGQYIDIHAPINAPQQCVELPNQRK